MRTLISAFLVVLFAWQLVLKAGVWLWYGFNRSYIASELCENRDKPEMKCNGQCVLAKRLKAAEEERRDAQERPLRIIEKIELSQYLPVRCGRLPELVQIADERVCWPASRTLTAAYIPSLFHPPQG